MKKLLLIAALLFASFGAFAAGDQFDTFVDGLKGEAKENGQIVRADKQHRMVFIDLKLPAEVTSLTDEQVAEVKSGLLKEVKSDKDEAAVIKELNVTIIFNFVTKDGKIYSAVVGSGDL